MQFTFETQYNAKTMASMARALRKTIRKKRSSRSHLFGWIVFVLGLILIRRFIETANENQAGEMRVLSFIRSGVSLVQSDELPEKIPEFFLRGDGHLSGDHLGSGFFSQHDPGFVHIDHRAE